MFSNVLVGVDARDGGRDAIALARQLARPHGTLTLAHIYGTVSGRGGTAALPAARAESLEMLERERELVKLDARFALGEGPVARGLHGLATGSGADLLVIGSTRRGPLGRVLMGDDCRATLDRAPCAVAIAPRGYARMPRRLEHLGVGYDGTPESECALEAARQLAALTGCEVKALWVVSVENVRQEKPIPADWPQALDSLVESHSERLSHLEGVTGVVLYGGPREELAQFAEHVDLLIVGSHGYGPAARVLHDSVTRYLVAHATCPLLVLPGASAAAIEPGPDVAVAAEA